MGRRNSEVGSWHPNIHIFLCWCWSCLLLKRSFTYACCTGIFLNHLIFSISTSWNEFEKWPVNCSNKIGEDDWWKKVKEKRTNWRRSISFLKSTILKIKNHMSDFSPSKNSCLLVENWSCGVVEKGFFYLKFFVSLTLIIWLEIFQIF